MNSRKITLFFTRIRVSNRDFGLCHTLFRGFTDGLLGKVFLVRQYIIYEKQLTREALPNLNNAAFEFIFLSPHDTAVFKQIEALSGLPYEWVAAKMIAGGECIVARNYGVIAGFNLISTHSTYIKYLNIYLSLPEGEAWSEQITVAPEYRRCGLASDLRYHMFNRLANKGYTKLIGGYVPFNKKSGMLAKKLGFVETEKITFIKMFGSKKLFRRVLSSSFSVSFVPVFPRIT